MRVALPANMRRIYLMGSFVALVAALWGLWTFRFQCSPDLPTWRLADLRAAASPVPGLEWLGSSDQPKLRLKVDAANPRVAARLVIPGIPAVNMLHLRFQMSARGLAPGKEKWEDGRAMIEWHQPDDAAKRGDDPVGSVRHDEKTGLADFVVLPLKSPAIPALRLEHLGRAGEFELSDLEITVVQERAIWKTGRWFLACAWLAWVAAYVRSWPGIPWWRAILASAVWIFMGNQFVVPGPWKHQRPLVSAFRLGAESTVSAVPSPVPSASVPAKSSSSALTSGPLQALGKITDQGGLVLRVKARIAQARPLLHALMLFAPALALAWLAGRKPAMVLAGILALATELAQFAFGYGFDWVDVFDLASDATGIALAMWVYGKMMRKAETLKS